uniref:Uncharacterized protein n=1 Tax=Arundo donax TaxID=35708 RepID=A0A0A9BXW0_ARUDO
MAAAKAGWWRRRGCARERASTTRPRASPTASAATSASSRAAAGPPAIATGGSAPARRRAKLADRPPRLRPSSPGGRHGGRIFLPTRTLRWYLDHLVVCFACSHAQCLNALYVPVQNYSV